MHLVGFSTESYYDAWIHEYQRLVSFKKMFNFLSFLTLILLMWNIG